MKILVLVESPSKTKKIAKFLNSDQKEIQYIVKASVGHIRDLPHDSLGIDDDFNPTYEVTQDKKKVVKEIQFVYKSCDDVYLATDPDREGERISYDLAHVLKLKDAKKIVFNEITKTALKKAVKNIVKIDMNIVRAQTCRRLLDRLIGFKISPVVQANVEKKTSAGRVQSIVTRLICDKEREIEKFKSTSLFEILGEFVNKNSIKVNGILNKTFKGKKGSTDFLKSVMNETFTVKEINISEHKNKPPPPFITSTVQQLASRTLRFSVKKTMTLLQKLYQDGHITYIRTDSTNISEEAIEQIGEEVVKRYGEKYLESRNYVKKIKGAQQAHECIRPTHIEVSSLDDADENKLYRLIWKRTMASQMKETIINRVVITVIITNVNEYFVCQKENITFDGYQIVYKKIEIVSNDYEEIKEGEELKYVRIIANQKFKKHPPRYSEASLVKELEKRGIGRPSTYQASISKVQDKKYVIKKNISNEAEGTLVITLEEGEIMMELTKKKVEEEKGKIVPTPLGMKITDFLEKKFENIMDYKFTSQVETKLDLISTGDLDWKTVIKDYYNSFIDTVNTMSVQQNGKLLGKHEGEDIYLYEGKYGPYIRFNDKCHGVSDMDVSLEEAILAIPLVVGKYNMKEIILKTGAYGKYIRYNGENFSVKEGEMKEGDYIEIIKRGKPKKFEYKKKKISVINGKYGPYIRYNNKNYKIPSKIDINDITLEKCKEIIDN